MKIILIILLMFIAGTATGQESQDVNVLKEEIQKLSFIVGEWEGEGWMMGRDGTKHSFLQSENVQFKLDSTAILIEGIGKSENQIIHNAIAVIRFNLNEGNYTFTSFLSTGQGGEFIGEVIDEKFYWYPNENMRYIIELNDEGQWFEKGEIKQSGKWLQFFEMTLNRV